MLAGHVLPLRRAARAALQWRSTTLLSRRPAIRLWRQASGHVVCEHGPEPMSSTWIESMMACSSGTLRSDMNSGTLDLEARLVRLSVAAVRTRAAAMVPDRAGVQTPGLNRVTPSQPKWHAQAAELRRTPDHALHKDSEPSGCCLPENRFLLTGCRATQHKALQPCSAAQTNRLGLSSSSEVCTS